MNENDDRHAGTPQCMSQASVTYWGTCSSNKYAGVDEESNHKRQADVDRAVEDSAALASISARVCTSLH